MTIISLFSVQYIFKTCAMNAVKLILDSKITVCQIYLPIYYVIQRLHGNIAICDYNFTQSRVSQNQICIMNAIKLIVGKDIRK